MKLSLVLALVFGGIAAAQEPAAAPAPAPDPNVLDQFQWQEAPDPSSSFGPFSRMFLGLPRPLLDKNGEGDSLTLAYNGPGPLQSTLRTIGPAVVSKITSNHYAIMGKLKYTNVAAGSYLEMWSYFAPEQPGGPEGSYFSRTAADAGPMAKLEGTDDGRDFSLPFDATGVKTKLIRLVLNIHLGGPGRIELRQVKLMQYPDTAAPVAVQIPASPGEPPSILPASPGEPSSILPKERILTVSADGSMSIDGAPYSSIDALQPVLQAFQRTHQVLVIRAAQNVSYDQIRQILDACKQAGLQQISFATMKPADATAPPPNSSDQKPVVLKPITLLISRRDGDGLEFRLGNQTYSSLVELIDGLKNNFDPRSNSLVFSFSDNVDRNSLQKVSSALADIGISSAYVYPDSLQPRRMLDWKSFLLGMLTTCLLLLAIAGMRIVLSRWNQIRHARELRRIASLDT
jgi:biopolymer transport protein ExbD